jgi:glycerol dehydrogenase
MQYSSQTSIVKVGMRFALIPSELEWRGVEELTKTLAAPGKYIQGRGLIEDIYKHISFIGKRFLLLTDEVVFALLHQQLEKGMADAEINFERHGGESTVKEGERVALRAKQLKCDGILGIGGGKVIDTAKMAGDLADIAIVIVPTIAASDAPCSAVSVIYDAEGTFVRSSRIKRNPDVVLVDTDVISTAPVRTLVAGMGDAFATYYEARACDRSGACNYTGGVHSEAAFALAELCNRILIEYGAQAKKSVEKKTWSLALEKVVEANIYLSGVGFENNGCAIAHALYNGMTAVLKPFPVFHGEGVAYGTLVQLASEYLDQGEWNEAEWKEVTDFYQSVGLPMKLSDLDGSDAHEDALLLRIGEATCGSGPNAHKMPFQVTAESIAKAIQAVDERTKKLML